jgi:hypothetical protein
MLAKISLFCMVLRQNRQLSHQELAIPHFSLAQNGAPVYRMERFEHPEALWSGRSRHTTPHFDGTRFHMSAVCSNPCHKREKYAQPLQTDPAEREFALNVALHATTVGGRGSVTRRKKGKQGNAVEVGILREERASDQSPMDLERNVS